MYERQITIYTYTSIRIYIYIYTDVPLQQRMRKNSIHTFQSHVFWRSYQSSYILDVCAFIAKSATKSGLDDALNVVVFCAYI